MGTQKWWEQERDKEIERYKQRYRKKDRHRDRQRDIQKEIETDRERKKQKRRMSKNVTYSLWGGVVNVFLLKLYKIRMLFVLYFNMLNVTYL